MEIKIKKKDNGYQALYEGGVHQFQASGENRNADGLKISVIVQEGTTDRNSIKPEITQGKVIHPCLMTRFQLENEDGDILIESMVIEQSKDITSQDTYLLRVIGSADYRTRVGGREKSFDFIVENCATSIHIQEVNIKGRKLYYLVVKNMV